MIQVILEICDSKDLWSVLYNYGLCDHDIQGLNFIEDFVFY